jgi:hypothetical protein
MVVRRVKRAWILTCGFKEKGKEKSFQRSLVY